MARPRKDRRFQTVLVDDARYKIYDTHTQKKRNKRFVELHCSWRIAKHIENCLNYWDSEELPCFYDLPFTVTVNSKPRKPNTFK